MKFFGGLTIEEAAGVLGISHATGEREWNFDPGLAPTQAEQSIGVIR